jgi:hypothetical protein
MRRLLRFTCRCIAEQGGRRGIVQAILWILAVMVGVCAMAAPVVAFFFPLENESREGATWLYVLAMRANVSPYDHSQHAFAGLGHGPMDPLLKTLLTYVIPSLESWQVIRFFVLLLPLLVLATSVWAGRGRATLLWRVWAGLSAYAVWSVISSRALLVGRSDATALCFACGMVLLWFVRPRQACTWREVAMGACGSVVCLTNWRFFPLAGSLALWPLIRRRLQGADMRSLLLSVALLLSGATTVWIATVGLVFHADVDSYYRHFFAVFTGEGWGLFPADARAFFARSVFAGLIPTLAVLLLAWGVLGFVPGVMEKGARVKLQARALLLSAGLGAAGWALYKNYWGGERHYFVPPLVLLWAFALDSKVLDSRSLQRWFLTPTQAFALYFAMSPVTLLAPAQQLYDLYGNASTFMATVRGLDAHQGVHSEGLHMFRTRYDGTLVDAGDGAWEICKAGLYGPDFGAKFWDHVRAFKVQPPAYVLSGGVTDSPPLRAFLREHRYRPVLVAGHHYVIWDKWRATLWARPDMQLMLSAAAAKGPSVSPCRRRARPDLLRPPCSPVRRMSVATGR